MNTMKPLLTLLGAFVALAGQAEPAAAETPAAPAPTAQAHASPSVDPIADFYSSWKHGPIWFRGAATDGAVTELANILVRAPAEGFELGPKLAALAEASLRQAKSGKAADIAAADRTISAIWVTYVLSLRRLPAGVTYGHPSLAPQGIRTREILPLAAAAPSLIEHVREVAGVNPIYAELRDAAWAEMQASGSDKPDPRVLQNLDRARMIPAKGRFVVVNTATQQLWMYEGGRPVDSMKVIVGMAELPTPMIASVIEHAVFNPFWNVPDHLVRKFLAPNVLKHGVAFLKDDRYIVMSDWSPSARPVSPKTINWQAVAAGITHVRVRENPGPGNSMGTIKFPFPNGEGIYLHDTPKKELFAPEQRALSNGCVRLEDAARFGRWLMGRELVRPSDDPEVQAPLPVPVPVYITYITAQPKDGRVEFARDVYGWDKPAGQLAAATE